MISITSSRYRDAVSKVPLQAANAIDLLLAEMEAGKQQIDALLATVAECREKAFIEGYADSLLGAAVGSPDEVPAFVGQTVSELRAKLEAAEKDAERYRWLRAHYTRFVALPDDGPELDLRAIGEIGDAYEGQVLDQAIDAALAQRQGEGS
ncbi:hypothetical protein WT41_01525 [Burkholderia territorii]|nr:hypothetical protein WT41_01525 [Burkholderia territorii]